MPAAAPAQGRPPWALAAVLLLVAAALQSAAQVHTQVEILDDSCDSQLDALWGNYTAPPVSPVAGCDRACLSACHDTLYDAIYSEQQQHCPLQTDIVRCFHVYRAQWYSFVEECALFQWGVAVGGAEGEGEGASSTPAAPAADAEAAATPAAEGEAGMTAQPAPAAEAEAGRRRVLLQEAEAALGSNTTSVYNGCFPSFASANDFKKYINGEWVWETDSPAVGITLSVLFFTSLLLLGIGLPKWVKFWKHPRVTGLFKRNKATKLEAPAAEQTPAAAAVDAKDTSSVVEPVAAAAS
ncbi:polyhomeotic 2 [Micractinium conductrix]|uniref:Polyhomeotic 2 n=1 Tax=Micractinium conductrix TaxID=554055 RepID=A0A2P6VDV4_9CHLO|nr:polyhomeotic 2 [Micractinium conductrix]|eukprot:PSC72241.1 polyhomeotic 2 [Micractinium conductrix]